MYNKIIYFGCNRKDYLDSGYDQLAPYEGEYIDVIEINGRNYLFTKGVSKVKNGIIDVREIIQDVNVDGSYVVYANASRSQECQDLEKIFNLKTQEVPHFLSGGMNC